MSDYTPTTAEIRGHYSWKSSSIVGALEYSEGLSEFERWLTAHDAAIRAEAGDEHHTMDELYEYRMLYNAHAAHGWDAAGIPVVKSWHHSDGEKCFGGGWFIVTATLPTGQVSNHYAAEHWDLFDVPAVELPPEYDGHSPNVAAERLRQSAAEYRKTETEAPMSELPEQDATPDEAFELGRVAGYSEAIGDGATSNAEAWDEGVEAHLSRRERDVSLPLTNPYRKTTESGGSQ